MKLSDAIRKGSMQREQGFLAASMYENAENVSCALGAAWEGTFGAMAEREHDHPWSTLRRLYPVLGTRAVCPVVECVHAPRHGDEAMVICYHLNDIHRWTREQIADWLDQIEDSDPSVGRA